MSSRWRWVAGVLLITSLHAQPPSMADLARHSQYTNVKLSPDGHYLAASGEVKGQHVLAVIKLSDMKGVSVHPRGDDEVLQFWWVSPTRLIYSVEEHFAGYDAPMGTGELFGVNANGSGARLLYGYRNEGGSGDVSARGSAQVIATIPDDPYHALVAISSWSAAGKERELPIAYRMDVRDGRLATIITAPGRGMAFVADHQGRIRLAYGEDNTGKLQVYQHALDEDGWQRVNGTESSRSAPLGFNADDSLVYFYCRAGSALGVCTWSPATKKWQTIWTHPTVDADGLVRGLDNRKVIGIGYEDGRPSIALLNDNSTDAKVLLGLMQQFPNEQVQITSSSRDGQRSILYVDSDMDPGRFFLYERASGKTTPLLATASWIDPAKMAAKQPFEFTARDGLKLHGYISYPPGLEQARHLPLVVFVHGGPYGIRDWWDYDPLVQVMATRGFAVLQVNFRGSGGYGYPFEKAGWGEWGGKMQDDVTDATHWAVDQGIADPKRLCIFGASYGGYAALEGAVKEPNLYRCAIGYVGVYDLPLMYQRGDIPQSSYGESYLKRVLGTDMQALAARSPINQLDTLKARVMLIVGGEDPRVPAIQGLNLHRALLNRGIAHVWLQKEGETHGFYDEKNLAELYQSLVQFLTSQLGPGQTATAKSSTGASPSK